MIVSRSLWRSRMLVIYWCSRGVHVSWPALVTSLLLLKYGGFRLLGPSCPTLLNSQLRHPYDLIAFIRIMVHVIMNFTKFYLRLSGDAEFFAFYLRRSCRDHMYFFVTGKAQILMLRKCRHIRQSLPSENSSLLYLLFILNRVHSLDLVLDQTCSWW